MTRAERNALVLKLGEDQDRNASLGQSRRQLMDRISRTVKPDLKAAKSFLLGGSRTYRACHSAGLLPAGSSLPRVLNEAERRSLGVNNR
ncbi:MAG TPA: hypothetical protein VFN88_11685 [Caulobacteraceae bacterium]|nr:hypothetical protein [Caulobacteraceae bacterium]